MSLVDQSLIPFQTAIPQLLFLIWVIFAGNTAYVSLSVLINIYLPIRVLKAIIQCN